MFDLSRDILVAAYCLRNIGEWCESPQLRARESAIICFVIYYMRTIDEHAIGRFFVDRVLVPSLLRDRDARF